MGSASQEASFELAQALPLLEATPGTLRTLFEGLPDAWLHFQEDPEAWSPHTVLVHLIHNERTNWMVRARVILSDTEERTFPPFRQLPELEAYDGAAMAELLDQFSGLRMQNLQGLRDMQLEPADLEREGIHPVLGEVTLGQLLATWVVHDFNHLHQIAKTLAKRYQAAVGPWRVNLAILDL